MDPLNPNGLPSPRGLDGGFSEQFAPFQPLNIARRYHMTSYCPNCRYKEDYKLLDLCPECFTSMVEHPTSLNAKDVFVKRETSVLDPRGFGLESAG
jgi:hypothetical protein